MPAMRDVFWNRIYEKAREDRNIVILSADFSAPSLDQFRLNLPAQYIFTGISEQSMILAAVGMALEGKKPFCYAIAPFISMRCYEQVRLYAAGMDLPITLVGVGAGIAYEDSGYTHHALEDIALMRILPNMHIYQPYDNVTVKKMADMATISKHPLYVRLDRFGIDNFFGKEECIETGMNIIRPVEKVTILASGNMVHTAMEAADELEKQGIYVGVIDVCILPLQKDIFKHCMQNAEMIITLEEHTLPGGFGSYILELISDLEMPIKLKRKGFDFSKGYTNEYGGRQIVHAQYGMNKDAIVNVVEKWRKDNG